MKIFIKPLIMAAVFTMHSAHADQPQQDTLMKVADDYLVLSIERDPLAAYDRNIRLEDHSGFYDNSPSAVSKFANSVDELLARLQKIDSDDLKGTDEYILYAQLTERLESLVQQRVCKAHLWDLNHMWGMQVSLPQLAEFQPVETEEERNQALKRWKAVAPYFLQEIENLKAGLETGYTMPAQVATRVAALTEDLINLPIDQSPLMVPARNAEDTAFSKQFRTILEQEAVPAMRKYLEFVKNEYIPQTRQDRAITSIPNGRECYMALFRSYTSLKWTPEQIYQIGKETVSANIDTVIEVGREAYGLTDFKDILAENSKRQEDGFASEKELQAYYEAVKQRAKAASQSAFTKMPESALVITPIEKHEQGKGISAHYRQGDKDRPGQFRYDPSNFKTEQLGRSEILTVHEGYPGHHLQISIANEQANRVHEVQKLLNSTAYAEGWARYSEALAEELGIYKTDYALISRRSWPARGMVADTAMHILGWDEEKTFNYLQESGRFSLKGSMGMLDRMAAIPAQLTSYDSGALEIFALRKLAKEKLGSKFDLKEFHQIVLQNGSVPLWLLREQVEDWIKTTSTP